MCCLILLAIPIVLMGILCCNFLSNGSPLPDGMWVTDKKNGGIKYKRYH